MATQEQIDKLRDAFKKSAKKKSKERPSSGPNNIVKDVEKYLKRKKSKWYEGCYEVMSAESIYDNVTLLVVSSAAGALVRALNPSNNEGIGNKVLQGVIGVLSSIFLGPLLGGVIEPYVEESLYAVSAAGFICGISGIEITKAVSGKFFKWTN